jgi:nucleoside-diphosphate-sugar epimerase
MPMPEIADKRILVIGGAGFIGSHIVERLLAEPVREIVVFDNFVRGKRESLLEAARDPRVRIVDASVTDTAALAAATEGIDYVFHLAALWLHECVHAPRSAVEVNVVGTYNVIEACIESGVKRVVFSSSASVYGNAIFTPMTEEHPFANRTLYGATKIAGEQFLRAMNEQHGLDYIGLRYMNVYGPRMDDRGTYVSVIVKVLDRIAQGLPPVIFGDGSQSYDFVHVVDVARANVAALKSDASDVFLNVGTGVGTDLNTLIQQLLELAGSTIPPEYRPEEQSFVTHRIGSIEAARDSIGFEAEVSLREGLFSVVEWKRSQESSTAKV